MELDPELNDQSSFDLHLIGIRRECCTFDKPLLLDIMIFTLTPESPPWLTSLESNGAVKG